MDGYDFLSQLYKGIAEELRKRGFDLEKGAFDEDNILAEVTARLEGMYLSNLSQNVSDILNDIEEESE